MILGPFLVHTSKAAVRACDDPSGGGGGCDSVESQMKGTP